MEWCLKEKAQESHLQLVWLRDHGKKGSEQRQLSLQKGCAQRPRLRQRLVAPLQNCGACGMTNRLHVENMLRDCLHWRR